MANVGKQHLSIGWVRTENSTVTTLCDLSFIWCRLSSYMHGKPPHAYYAACCMLRAPRSASLSMCIVAHFTVRLELALISHVLTIARNELRMELLSNPVKLIPHRALMTLAKGKS
jgi:hypothetical protein